MVKQHSIRHLMQQPALAMALLILLIMGSLPAWASLSATVDRNEITEGEALVYTLRSDGLTLRGSPDFAPLEKDFDILGTSRSNQIRMINGENASWVEWNITLMPKREGTLTLPALTFGDSTSNPIQIKVHKTSAQQGATASSPVYMRSSLSAETLWEGQEAVLTLKIFTRADFADNPDLSSPQAEGAIIKLISNDKREERIINGVRYQVISLEYLVTPTRAGELRISGQVLTGALVEDDPYGRPSLLRMTRSRPFRISSPEMLLTVNPPPENWPAGTPWLPAESLSLSESWSSNPAQLKTGDSITRTITVTAEGTNSALIPPLPALNLNGVNSYPDQPATDNRLSGTQTTGIRSESVALVPTQAGEITLPAVELTWFNTKTGQIEISTLAAQTLNIAAGSQPAVQPQAPVAVSPTTTTPSSNASEQTLQSGDLQTIGEPVSENSLFIWQAATAVFALLWLLTLAYVVRLKRGSPSLTKTTKTSFPSHTSESELFKALINACQNNEAAILEQRLVSWGTELIGKESLTSSEVISTLNSDELSKGWNLLLSQRYSTEKSALDTTPLVNLLTEARKQWFNQQSEKSNNTLRINP
ncbi:BatD family protein [Parendozoicomonas haliclonae]|uniref:DUF7939 domain-containing protein n=1 Tax=Parendozoicomonas haliclonae TaxID=1960125 RepID=A0A1X7AMQ3_9GAMM|nr:BatD family protein [Parendozoicomonas haliclonae]SMA49261.1 hypothetical protein EHSB41UT_03145 [Parendozoicomonas haliclonae]